MQPILTLTVNPALDVSTATERVFSGHKLRCGASRLDPGGGGVNVSRVVQRLGGRTLAVYTAGGPTGEAYRRLIEAERIPTLAVPIQGSTREDFTVDETTTGKQFRFVLQGPELSEPEWRLAWRWWRIRCPWADTLWPAAACRRGSRTILRPGGPAGTPAGRPLHCGRLRPGPGRSPR